jgi:phospholipid-binding lipoprotein MlaA
VIFNDLLQGKFKQGVSDIGRVTVNTTLGIGGLLDLATPMGMSKHDEDLGQTFGTWGAGEGRYAVLPFAGPSSVRDAPDLLTSTLLNPLTYIGGFVLLPVGALGVINTRANLLDATRIRDEAALDPYTFVREAYRQRRTSLIYDGDPPPEQFEEFDDDTDDAQGEDKLKVD